MATTKQPKVPAWLVALGILLGVVDGMRLSETGTGFPILESTGGANPAEKAEWGKCGVKTEQDANKIGAGIFRFGELVAT